MCTPIVPINVKNLLVLLAFGLCVESQSAIISSGDDAKDVNSNREG